jgi:hypothetical protein
MRRINFLVTLYSVIALVVIIERLSPTTQILLQPFNFIRLHEINQTVIFLTATVILSFFILQSVTKNFEMLKEKSNFLLALLFVAGVYLYGAGEGWHEIASFTLNQYCDLQNLLNNLCKGLFINDYFAGNIIFFVGGVFMNASLLALSANQPVKRFNNKDMIILLINSLVYAFTWFAYAAFDKVLVGFFFSSLLMLISLGFFLKVKKKAREYPYITYSALAYTLATIATLFVKLH